MQQYILNKLFYILLPIALISCIESDVVVDKSKPFIKLCREFKEDIEFAKSNKYISGNPLTPSQKINMELSNFVKLTTEKCSKNETKKILKDIKNADCYSVLQDLSILAEEQMENKAVDDFIKYYSNNKIPKIKGKNIITKIKLLQDLMKIKEGYSFVYLDNYFVLTANEMEMINNLNIYVNKYIDIDNFKGDIPNLNNKYVTFVGSGFPLSGISINILTGAKINLIDIDKIQLEKAKKFLNIIHKAGIIDIKDFSFIHADGKEVSYSKIKTDILHLASALPRGVKKEIFSNISQGGNMGIIVIDRYVSGIFKLLYEKKVYSKEIPNFITIAKIYPENIYGYKSGENQDIITKPTSIINVNSSRLLILRKNNENVIVH